MLMRPDGTQIPTIIGDIDDGIRAVTFFKGTTGKNNFLTDQRTDTQVVGQGHGLRTGARFEIAGAGYTLGNPAKA